MSANDEESRILTKWSHDLAAALQIRDLNIDQELILDLARKSADTVTHAAAPVTAFLVGYAAGMRASNTSESISNAADIAFTQCEIHGKQAPG